MYKSNSVKNLFAGQVEVARFSHSYFIDEFQGHDALTDTTAEGIFGLCRQLKM